MGLAASQGRLLLLTARKSDLEYRAQEISQRRLLLATELETVSAKYARKTANRQMKIVMKETGLQQGEANRTKSLNLTYSRLMQYGTNDGDKVSDYRVKNAKGEIVVPTKSDLEALAKQINANSTDSPYQAGEKSTIKATISGNKMTVSGKDQNGNTIHEVYTIDTKINDQSATENYFQEGLRNGRYIIEQRGRDAESNAESTWSPQGWSGMTDIEDNYYTDDDATAQAEYQTASASVQAQDKKLETDQKQIETQHKAVETEFESVSKVIQNNIENSFKMFS